ncbi:DUF2381 family protein [Myxococcus sp. RHSTA-1-4]|uniref:DUF2381 family protein n=1 Tax=Myxococcus sp. RHSTA-1-4 TaxID=2874601 RepID=UPI001CC153B9|nr:DUF2381 family protein [Myxococcus sp. RHSTA-1-4]MBZ4418658.1 DUF2381 family protein [Myxococcus sp. RHSTA-1-4]
MSTAPAAALLVLVLLATASAAAQPGASRREMREQSSPSNEESPGPKPEVRISPTDSTVVLFDAPLAHVEVEQPERFRRIREAGDTLLLVPAGRLVEGTRVGLTLYFQDGAEPEHAVLVVDTSAGRQEVYRRPSSPGPPHEEAEALREENRRLRQEVERLRAALSRPGGLIRLLANGPLVRDDLAVRCIDTALQPAPGSPLRVHAVCAYRVGAEVALVLEVEDQDATRPWQAGSASLAATGAMPIPLTAAPEVPLGPGERGRIVVGAVLMRKKARAPFTLTVREASGGPALTLGHVLFP